MSQVSTGTVIIDSDYKIVNFSEAAAALYPGLHKGALCYKAFINRSVPCNNCPVMGGTLDDGAARDVLLPESHAESLLEVPLANGKTGYVLTFKLAGEKEQLTQRLAADAENMHIMGIINTLSGDVSDLYEVNIATREVKVYRSAGKALGVIEEIKKAPVYEAALEAYIAQNVHPDDMEEMRQVADLANIRHMLEDSESFFYHYRVLRDGEVHYYYMKCTRIGTADSYASVILAFANEDASINKSQLKKILQQERQQELVCEMWQDERDAITGLYTQRAFAYHAKKLLENNPEDTFNVSISDIKNFELVNTMYGEAKGNELLQWLANFYVEAYPDGIVGCYGIDQMVSIYKNPTLEQKVKAVSLFKHYLEKAPVPNVVVKFGVYENVDRNVAVAHMCARALLALNSIKRDFRRTFAKYSGPISQNQLRAQTYEARFSEAIQKKEFVVWYQPKYNPYNDKIVGAEALVRWQTPEGMIPPGEFLDVFESDGLIEKLDEYVFRTVCQQQKAWADMGRELLPVSVNVSRCSLFGQDIVGRYKKIIEEC
ncbi:MAG: EAL domain-containing protein, partial [Phascolarctobacterium sp.]|nr:EAL domain-containing protein [Phascolarctobacterium sp.]